MNRRQFLRGGTALGTIAASAAVTGALIDGDPRSRTSTGPAGGTTATPASGYPPLGGSAVEPLERLAAQVVPFLGAEQPGITRPVLPQRHLQLSVWRITPGADVPEIVGLLDALGRLGRSLADYSHPAVAPFAPAGLTLTAGLGPIWAHRLVPSDQLADFRELPPFARDQLTASTTGGDVLVQLCADDPSVLAAASAALGSLLTGITRLAWAQAATRGESRSNGSTRNALGFLDGVVAPRAAAELSDGVWLPGPSGSRGSIMVVRRMRIDLAAFHGRGVGEQERVIGRRRDSGAPLSGGRPDDNIDPGAKSANGDYLVAVDAHARRADPRPAGLPLMLRRSYSYDNGPTDQGLLFISFQNRLRTFVRTQQRMDEKDALNALTRTTASGAFWILPGVMSGESGLGSSFGRR